MLRQPFDKSTTQVCAHAPVLLWHLPVRKGLCLEPKIGPGQCNSVHSAMHIYRYVWSLYCWHKLMKNLNNQPSDPEKPMAPSSWLCNFGVGQPGEAWWEEYQPSSWDDVLVLLMNYIIDQIRVLFDQPMNNQQISPVATFLACTKPAGIHSLTAIFFMAVMWPLSSLPTTWHQQQFGFGFQFQGVELMKCDMSQMTD